MDLAGCVKAERGRRAGRLSVEVAGDVLLLDWELGAPGGGVSIVCEIFALTPDQWRSQAPWQRFDRGGFLDALGRELCRLECPRCQYRIDDVSLQLYRRTLLQSFKSWCARLFG